MNQRHAERGQTLTEFAITASLMLLLMFGVIDFGRALFDYNRVAQAARLGARYAMVDTPQPEPSNDCATAGGTCQSNIITYLENKTGLPAAQVSPSIVWGPSTNTTCTTNPTANGVCWVRVNLNYQFSFILLPLGTHTFHASSEEVLASQYCPSEPASPCPQVTP